MYGDCASFDEIFYAIEQETSKEDVYLLKLELEGDLYEDGSYDMDSTKYVSSIINGEILIGMDNMNKYIYCVNSEYFTIEATDLHHAMVLATADGGTVIGEYTAHAHLFNE